MSTPSDGTPPDEPGRAPWDRPAQPGQPGTPAYGTPSQPYGAPAQPPYDQPGQPGQPGAQPPYGTPGGQPYAAPGQPGAQPPYAAPGQPGGQPPYAAPGQPGAQPYGGQFGAPGQQPPYGQNPYGAYPNAPYGQPPATKSRRPLFLIIGGVVAAIVAAIVVLGAIGVGAGDPRDTADKFMAALKSKDVDKAHSLLCKDGQDKESKDELRSDFDLTSRTITGYSLGTERTRDREGKKETLIPVTVDYDQGSQVKLELGVWDEGGQKVCSLNDPGDN